MFILFAICGLVIMFAYEIRHRFTNTQISYLDDKIHRLSLEIKGLKETLAKIEEAEKKSFKFNFFNK